MSFMARYHGTCTACRRDIYVGQTIAEDTAGGFSHLTCLEVDDEPDLSHISGRPCPRCHLIHAGECF